MSADQGRSRTQARKVTDLERFAHEQVMRPFAPLLGYEVNDPRLRTMPVPMSEIPALAAAHPDWWSSVTDRISRCGFWFPPYISHPLLDLLASTDAVTSNASGATP